MKKIYSWFVSNDKLLSIPLKGGLLLSFILFSIDIFASDSMQDKNISIDIKNGTLIEVLNTIKAKTGYEIFYISSEISNVKEITIHSNSISVEEILKKSLEKTNLKFSFEKNTIVISKKNEPSNESKTITVKGIVVDRETGTPLPGALVSILGTTKGAITDEKGAFSLVTDANQELEVSFVGMKNLLQKAITGMLSIAMEKDIQAIKDVVVVGYGTRKRELLTGSVETVKGEELAQQATMRLDEALIGQTAGVFVSQQSGDPTSLGEVVIRVRGQKGDAPAPLLVIDGTPRFGVLISNGEMRLSDINPNDVESISILKDAAAAAIYGSRAANGVILVTTKRGEMNKKFSISYSGKVNIQQAAMMPKFLDNYEFAKLYNVAIGNTAGTKVEKYTNEQLDQIKNGTNPDIYANEDLTSYLKKYGFATSHSLSMSGGSNSVSYYTSGSYTATDGLYSGIKNDKYNYNARIDAKLIDGLTLSFDVMGSGFNSKNPSYQTISSLYSYSPLQPLVWSNGEWVSINGNNPLVGINGLGGYKMSKAFYNTTSARLSYDLGFVTKGLDVYVKGVFDNNMYEERDFKNPVKLYSRTTNIVDGKEVVSYPVDNKTLYPNSKPAMSQRLSKFSNMLLEGGFNYNRTFGKNSISALLILNYQDNGGSVYRAENNAMSTSYPEFVGVTSDIGGATDTYEQRASMVGRVNYSYDSRYVLESSFRYDGSTKFHPNNRWGLFPTVSGAWNLSNERFFKDWKQSALSKVKLRASTGLLGNDAGIENFSYMYQYFLGNQSYQIGTNLEQAGLMMDTGVIPNSELRWGKSLDYNVGIDLGFFNNRLTADFEYYWRFNTNDIRKTPDHLFPPSIGTNGSTPFQNFGKTKTWGYDLSVGWRDHVGKDFSYSVDVMMSRSWDLVIDAGDESTLSEERRLAGKPISTTWKYVSDGLFQSKEEIEAHPVIQDGNKNSTLRPGDIRYRDFDGNNQLGEEDKRAFEYVSIPDYAMNLKLGFSFKGVYVNMLFQGVLNYKKNVEESYTLESSSLPRFQEYHLTDSWSPENPGGTYPVIKFTTKNDNNRLSSDYWYRDASYLRLRTLNIGYSLPAKYLSKVKLSSLSIGFQGGNLFTLCSLKGIDPDTDRGYPITRTYGFNINFGF